MSNQPNPLPIGQAASAPIGVTGGSDLSIIAELLIGIALPLLVPAILLSMARAIGASDGQALRLDELSFGVAGVAIASLVRAASRRDWAWPGFIIFIVLALLWFTVLGLSVNRESGVDEVIGTVQLGIAEVTDSPGRIAPPSALDPAETFLANLSRTEANRQRAEPDPWIWIAIISPGLLLVALASTYIVKVRR